MQFSVYISIKTTDEFQLYALSNKTFSNSINQFDVIGMYGMKRIIFKNYEFTKTPHEF